MKKEQNESLEMLNDEVVDLLVSDEQAEQAKGGVSLNYQAIKFDYKPQKSDD